MKKMAAYIKKHYLILLFAFIYSALVFVFSPQATLLYDSALYADIAKNLVTGGCYCSNSQFRPLTPPVFPLLVAGSMLLFGGFFIKALLAGISFFGILISYHFIMKISRNMRIALLSSILFFLTPLIIYNSVLLLMDLIFGIMVTLSIWAYIVFLEQEGQKEKGWKATIILALVTAIAIMTKMTGYVLIPIFLIHFVLDRKRHKTGFGKLLILLALIAAFLLPWTLWRSSGGLNELNAGSLLISGGVGHISLVIESFYYSGEPMNVNPLTLDLNVPVQIVNIARIVVSLLVYVTPLVSLYFAYALVKYKKHFRGRYDSLLLIWIFAFLAFFTFGFIYFGSRYLIPMVLPLTFFFARFLDSKKGRKNLLVALLILLQTLSVVAITYLDSRFIWTKSQTEIFTQTGEWIKENTRPEAKILPLGAPEGALAFYGERRITGINETIPDYIVKSNLAQSIDVASYEKQSGAGFYLVKAFSDEKYYSEIYKRV